MSATELFERIAAENDRPHIIFTAHLGNFELLPVAGRAYGLTVDGDVPAAEQPLHRRLHPLDAHARRWASLLASRRGAAFALAAHPEARRQYRRAGRPEVLATACRTTFFGRQCETSPLLPKLARQFECDVYPARCIRLPGNRFRLVIEEKLELPRDAEGKVDVAATAQLLNDVVERWVREDPGQWMWFHKRWKTHAAAQAGEAGCSVGDPIARPQPP